MAESIPRQATARNKTRAGGEGPGPLAVARVLPGLAAAITHM